MESPPLHVGEHQPWLLAHVPPLVPALILFLTLTCCGGVQEVGRHKGGRKRRKSCVIMRVVADSQENKSFFYFEIAALNLDKILIA